MQLIRRLFIASVFVSFPATAFLDFEQLLGLLHMTRVPFSHVIHQPTVSCNQDIFQDRLDEFGLACKQLFLRTHDTHDVRYILVIVHPDQQVDTKALARTFQTRRLTFATAEELDRILGVKPGAVTPFALANREAILADVRVAVDEKILNAHRKLTFPALRNDISIGIKTTDLMRFLNFHGYEVKPIQVTYKNH